MALDFLSYKPNVFICILRSIFLFNLINAKYTNDFLSLILNRQWETVRLAKTFIMDPMPMCFLSPSQALLLNWQRTNSQSNAHKKLDKYTKIMALFNSLPISNTNGSNLNKTKTESYTTVNGRMTKNVAEENKSGEMDPFMKEFLTITWPMAKEGLFILVAMFTKEIGQTTRLRARAFTCMQMARCTLGNG